MTTFPLLMEARVVSVDVPNRRVIVDIPSAQMLGIGCKMLVHGPADGARVHHKAMPGRGTWGLVAFPYGGALNGIWLGAFFQSLVTALTTNTDQFMDYSAHWSGAYELMDQNGKWTKSFPDGTYIQASDVTTKPTTYRQTVDSNQNQQLTEFKDSDRVPSPPSPRHLYIGHASGTTADIDPTGNVTVTGNPKKATCTFSFGGATVVVDDNGNITGTAASGSQVQLNANKGVVTIDKSGNITGAAASGAQVELTANNGSLLIDKAGGIYGNAAPGQHMQFTTGNGAASYTLVRTDLLVAAFNAHTHPDPQGGNTGTPTTPISDGTIQSIIAYVSE